MSIEMNEIENRQRATLQKENQFCINEIHFRRFIFSFIFHFGEIDIEKV